MCVCAYIDIYIYFVAVYFTPREIDLFFNWKSRGAVKITRRFNKRAKKRENDKFAYGRTVNIN